MLELAVAHALYASYPDFSEGRLAKIRSHVVSRASCAVVARELDLGSILAEHAPELAPDELERLARNRNVLAALLEAVLGALFLEHGFPAIEQAVVGAFSERIEYALTSHVDHKTELQEVLARSGRQVAYTVLFAEGPRTTGTSPARRSSTASSSARAAAPRRRRPSRRPRARRWSGSRRSRTVSGILSGGMAERRPSNSELRLRRLEQEEPDPRAERGILEIFAVEEPAADEDAPLARDDDGDEP